MVASYCTPAAGQLRGSDFVMDFEQDQVGPKLTAVTQVFQASFLSTCSGEVEMGWFKLVFKGK